MRFIRGGVRRERIKCGSCVDCRFAKSMDLFCREPGPLKAKDELIES